MLRRPLSATLFPYTTLFRSLSGATAGLRSHCPISAGESLSPPDRDQASKTTSLDRQAEPKASRLPQRRCRQDRKSTRLNSSHLVISYAVFCLKNKRKEDPHC